MRFTRRQALQSAAAVAASSFASGPFAMAFAGDGALEIVAGPSEKKLYRQNAAKSHLWTYNNTSPGPEIRVKRGDRIKVRLINNLLEPTSIHWHGIRIANAMDGVSGLTQDPISPGDRFEYDFVAPDAGTYWYHAHNRSWNQVARGLYGALIVDEEEPVFDRRHDMILVIDDWRLKPDGALDVDSLGSLADWSHGGRLGNWLTVNGETLPHFRMNAGEAYRLRLINASNARILAIDPARFNASILAYDGQPLPRPEKPAYTPFFLGPAQRIDLAVVPTSTAGFVMEELSGEPFAMAGFDVLDTGSMEGSIPDLPANSLPEPVLEGARIVTLNMTGGAMGRMGRVMFEGRVLSDRDFRDTRQMWAFNNVANISDVPLFSTKTGETVIIDVSNDTAFPHAMHLHGHHFRILQREGSDIDEGKPWRDTFLVGPTQTTRIALVADNPGKWLLHCHMLEHAAAGMNTWFEVT